MLLLQRLELARVFVLRLPPIFFLPLFRFLLPLLVGNHVHVLNQNAVSAGAHRDPIGLVDRPCGGLVKYLPLLFCVVSVLAGKQLSKNMDSLLTRWTNVFDLNGPVFPPDFGRHNSEVAAT